jgi:hypothetical protein
LQYDVNGDMTSPIEFLNFNIRGMLCYWDQGSCLTF